MTTVRGIIFLLLIGLGIGIAQVLSLDQPFSETQSRIYTEVDATILPEPTTVSWRGRPIGALAGGRGWAFERLPEEDPRFYFQAYFPQGEERDVGGVVTVHGHMTGIDCAYALTIFEGRCTPTVEIQTIEP